MDKYKNHPLKTLAAFVVAMALMMPVAFAQSSPTCSFYPDGQPICEPPNVNPLDFACPLCSEVGLPRITMDPAKMSTMETINQAAEQVKEVYGTYEDTIKKTQKAFGDAGPEGTFESDTYLPGLTFPKMNPGSYPNPEVSSEDDLKDPSKTYNAVARSMFLTQSNPPVEDQLAMQSKRATINQSHTVHTLAVATNRNLAINSSDGRESPHQKMSAALTRQAKEASEGDLRDRYAARGAILRAIYATQNSQMGMMATMLGSQSSQPFASGEVPITKPSYYDPASGVELQQGGNTAAAKLLNLNTMIENSKLSVNNRSYGPNVEGQILNLQQSGQKQKSEVFYNSVVSRAKAIQEIHQQRLWVKQSVLSIQNMEDTKACHDYATAQLQKFRNKIIPYLRLVRGSNRYWMGQPATLNGPYPQSNYPDDQSNLSAAFETIAGRTPNYQLRADEKGYDRVGGFRGKLLEYDTTAFTNIRTRHQQATLASCKVADLMMWGRSVPAAYRIFPTTCAPLTIRVNTGGASYITDRTYCLDDNVRQILAPMVINVPYNSDIEDAVHAIVPGSPPGTLGRQCLMNIRGGAPWIVNYARRSISDPNYNTAQRVGPPAGLLGKWLQAWKIEQYWADFRYGEAGSTEEGMEMEVRKAIEDIRAVNQKQSDLIKAINDADSREAGGLGDTERVTLDLSGSAGRLYSLNYQKQQVQLLRRDLDIKRAELAAYDAERNHLIPPAQAPAEVKKQWDAFIDNMEKTKAQIQQDIAMTESYIAIADDIVDDTTDAANNSGFDFRNNNCDIYYKPVVEKISADGEVPERYAPVQKRCQPLITPAHRCKGQIVPDDTVVRVLPGINDD